MASHVLSEVLLSFILRWNLSCYTGCFRGKCFTEDDERIKGQSSFDSVLMMVNSWQGDKSEIPLSI